MWTLCFSAQYQRDREYYAKKRSAELQAVEKNLGRYFEQLNASKNRNCVRFGFMHTEKAGVVALDQKSGGANLQETRLYVYADERQKIVHVITLGDKHDQKKDVQFSAEFARSLTYGKS